jgi:hypothetical protein
VASLLEELDENDERLRGLASGLSELWSKLPSELKTGSDAVRLDDPHWVRDVLNAVGPLLKQRLSSQGETT